MTDVGESVLVSMLLEHTSGCSLCKKEAKPTTLKTIITPSPNDDNELIANDSGELDASMGAEGDPRPTTWTIAVPAVGHKVTPNPHHLIPGNESLKAATSLLEWLFEEKGIINADVGYDVNNHRNGIWLPSNNSMRGDTRWNSLPFKVNYAVAAMDATSRHFHDRHGKPYSQFVTKLLNKIADRMNGLTVIDVKCPYVKGKKKAGKFDPPYFLYQRLNGLSQRLARYLTTATKAQDFLYTSKLVKEYWNRKGTKRLQVGDTV